MREDRIWEIDYLRTIAMSLMVLFHLIYDLDNFTSIDVDYKSTFWYWIGKTSALLFIFISGVSSGLSRRPFKRGLQVFSFGLLITLVTFILMPKDYVRFGILHFLGVSMMLYPLVRNLPSLMLFLLALFSFAIGYAIYGLILPFPWLLPLGIVPPDFSTIDYYPLFPYLGFSFLGFLGYKQFYGKGKRLFPRRTPAKEVTWMSNHSLGVYLIHQPILLALIYLASKL